MTFKLGHPQYNTGKTHFKKGHMLGMRFKKNHIPWNKNTKGKVPNGIDSHRYNGGLCFDKRSKRWLIWCRDNTYVTYARAIAECYVGPLTERAIVHHINNDSTDDRPKNLLITTRVQHVRIHRPRLKEKICEST